MAYSSSLEIAVGEFIEKCFPTKSAQASKLFWDGVEKHVGVLLTSGIPVPYPTSLLNEMFPDTASTFDFFQLWTRAVVHRSQSRLLERKTQVDIKNILSEQVRSLKAKGKIRLYRARII